MDNSLGSNAFTNPNSLGQGSQNSKVTRMRSTNSQYENNKNVFATFLSDKNELPRLSILDNYK